LGNASESLSLFQPNNSKNFPGSAVQGPRKTTISEAVGGGYVMRTDLPGLKISEAPEIPPTATWEECFDGSRLDRPVQIHALGRFSVQSQGLAVTSSVKARHQRPLELLQALIAHGGRGVHAELLGQALWPDAEGDKTQNTFDVTLHRLRQLLGPKDLLLVHDRRLTLNSELAWVDVWAFERAVNQAERLLSHVEQPQAEHQLERCEEQILQLYQGAFLEREANRTWTLSLRERLRSKFLRHVSDAGRAWEAMGEWDRAIRYYRRGLEVDPLIETLYQRLMCCLRDTGRVAEALATYQRCRTILAEQFGIEPSRATIELYRSLRS
jgi:two-component SAPR family response regulator